MCFVPYSVLKQTCTNLSISKQFCGSLFLLCIFEFDTLFQFRLSCVVPVVGVLGLGATPPDVGLLAFCLCALGHLFLFGRAADELHPSETVDPTGEKHPVVVEVHGTVAA